MRLWLGCRRGERWRHRWHECTTKEQSKATCQTTIEENHCRCPTNTTTTQNRFVCQDMLSSKCASECTILGSSKTSTVITAVTEQPQEEAIVIEQIAASSYDPSEIHEWPFEIVTQYLCNNLFRCLRQIERCQCMQGDHWLFSFMFLQSHLDYKTWSSYWASRSYQKACPKCWQNWYSTSRSVEESHVLTFTEGSTTSEMAAQNRLWLEDCAIRLLCVLALDRFTDFVSDKVQEQC
jgi:hypothetical protein